MEHTKVNLGCGKMMIDGYDNIDIKDGRQVYPLSYPYGSLQEIRASHILEHFGYRQIPNVLNNWVSKLKPGGVLKIAVPDFHKIVGYYTFHTGENVMGYLMGGQVDEYDYHKSMFDRNMLAYLMKNAGLENIRAWNDQKDSCGLPVSLNLKGSKMNNEDEQMQTIRRSIGCVISMPRLGFTANSHSIIRELAMRGISTNVGTGAYWQQVLTNMIEQEISKKRDYLLTIDYDTFFRYEQIIELMRIAEETGADAVVPMQIKRDVDSIIVRANKSIVTKDEYDRGWIQIAEGHFGCSIFRRQVFEKLEKPWFIPQPDEEGGWGKGRTDADIYFWRNFGKCGLHLLLATKVRLGHLQMMCTYPGRFEDNLKAEHYYMTDVEEGKLPDYILKG